MADTHHALLYPVLWPQGLDAPATRRPWLACLLVALNLAALTALYFRPGLVQLLGLGPSPRPWQYFTAPFVHPSLLAGALDLAFLWMFAPALEDRLGAVRLALLLLGAGAAGAITHRAFPSHLEPLSGSAALIMALAGAAMVILPGVKVRLHLGLNFLLSPLFAWSLLLAPLTCMILYIALELLLMQLEAIRKMPFILGGATLSVSAHLAGLAAGVALAALLRRSQPARPPVGVKRAVENIADKAAATMRKAAPDGTFPPTPIPAPAQPEAAAFQEDEAPPPPPPSMREPAAPLPEIIIEELFEAPGAGASAADAMKEEVGDVDLPAMSEEPLIHDLPMVESRIEQSSMLIQGATPGREHVMSAKQNNQPKTPPRPAEAARPIAALPKKVMTITPGGSEPGRAKRRPVHEDSASPLVIPALFAEGDATENLAPSQPAALPPEPEVGELSLETSEETQERAVALRDDTAWPEINAPSYAVILPPGRPPRMAALVRLFAEVTRLAPREAHQALLHRRGILADNVTREEAERVAGQFAHFGHPVLLAALTERVQYGGGLDLISLRERAGEVHFASVAQAIRAEWRQVVFLAAGQVTIAPGAPPRTVLDLFLAKPRQHLRLWDNTFAYARETPRFREQAIRITEQARRAIHTRSLDRWLRDPSEPLRQFATMLEYEHYLRWHLLAHLAPSKLVKY